MVMAADHTSPCNSRPGVRRDAPELPRSRARTAGPAFLTLLLTFLTSALHAQSLLDRRITIHAEKIRLAKALDLIAKDADCKLSYNAAAVPVDSIVHLQVEDRSVERVLRELLPKELKWKASGQHLIITSQAGPRQQFMSRGTVVDASSGEAIAWASVLEVQRGRSVTTGDQGDFSIALAGDVDRTPLRIARHGYRDTVFYLPRNNDVGRIRLKPLNDLERLEPLCEFERCGVEDLGVARLLVPSAQLQQAMNLGDAERRAVQLSLVPSVSTNGPLAGSAVNAVSVNVLGGYARGVDGLEVGGGVNIVADAMTGFQFGGLANLVGGRTRGVQVAGGLNHTMRSLNGLQFAGLSNTVWDTLSGVQVAGGVNVVKRQMKGTQVPGAANITLGDLKGVQVSGGVNVAHGAVEKSQVAGALNYARSVAGGQVAAGLNVSLGDVGGGQVGFGANYARSGTGGQVSFGANIVPGEVSGGQVGFGLNYAHHVTGGQFSFGANVVPGKVEAGQVGFGMNYAHHVTGGQFTFGANIVPGTVEGGQVGVFNFAVKALGGQVGIVNISDTVSGGAVGLLTISRKGYHRADLVCNDVMPLSVQLRTGTRVFHNILGYSPAVTSGGRWGFLYGFGFEPRLTPRGFLNIDLTGEQVVEQEEWVDAVNVVGRLSLRYGYTIHGGLVITAGPVLNVLVSDLRDPDSGTHSSTLPPGDPLFADRSGTAQVVGWLGWKAGVGVRF